MTRLYIIRHAEAEGNLYRRAQGHYDSRITAKGRLQIDALAERFKDIPIDALYASDLQRTRQTAGAILRYHPQLELVTSPRLREMSLGVWEDMAWGSAERAWPQEMYDFTYRPGDFRLEGAETFYQLAGRITAAVEDIAAAHPEQTVAVVSHGMAIRSLMGRLSGLPVARTGEVPHGDNTCVALLLAEGGKLRIEYCNDTSHLDRGISTFAGQTWWKEGAKADRDNLRFEPLDPAAEPDTYIACYGDAWAASHGDRDGFAGRVYLEQAKRHAGADCRCLMKVLQGEELIGLIELDPTKGQEAGAGWVTLCYLTPSRRGHGLGIQLIGHAVSVFRGMGRRSLRLHTAEENRAAISFYRRCGFRKIGVDPGVRTPLLLMEMEI